MGTNENGSLGVKTEDPTDKIYKLN